MPFITFTRTAYVELVYNIFQQRCQNTLYFQSIEPIDLSFLENAVATVSAWWVSNMKPLISNSLTLVEVTARQMDTEFGLYHAETYSVVGDLVSPALPTNVSLAIKFNSGKVGRRNRGRNYLVGLCESQATGNEILAATVQDFIDAYEELRLDMAAQEWTHVIASRATGAGVVTPVNSYTSDGLVDSQRRRLSGRGS